MSPLFTLFDLRLMGWVIGRRGYWLTARKKPMHSESVAWKQEARPPKPFFFLFFQSNMGCVQRAPFHFCRRFLQAFTPMSPFKRGLPNYLYKLAIVPSTSGTCCCSLLLNIFLLSTYHNTKCYLFFSVPVFPSQIGALRGLRIWCCFAHRCISSVHHIGGIP